MAVRPTVLSVLAVSSSPYSPYAIVLRVDRCVSPWQCRAKPCLLFLCSSVAMVAGPAPSIRFGGVTSVQLTMSMALRCSQLATRPHRAVILVVPCSNLEISSHRVVKTVSARVDGKASLQSCLCSFRCIASFATTYPSPDTPLPSGYHPLATPNVALPPRCATAPSVSTWPAGLRPPLAEPPPRLCSW